MFLKSLTMKGFKSFAETTTLEFEPGVTVVVGPNGSGKSNVVDAVAWVLGAQGPRTLRSTKMDDVIFAGTGKRPALGRAEVSLTIDNTSGLLAVDLNEVSLTRTLFRSGESEYAINGAPCRLLDVQEMLSDSGVGRQQHVIVSQGQLDGILNARPEDRRLLIEEAAGVLKYRRRREKAERRLDSTENNLVRLGDLLREVRRQIRPLERQADAVRRHDGLARELHGLRLHLAGRELVVLTRRRQANTDATVSLAHRSDDLSEALADFDQRIVESEAELSGTHDDGVTMTLGRLSSLAERGRGVAEVLAERRRSLVAMSGTSVDDDLISALEAESAKLATGIEATEAQARGLLGRAQELERAEAALEADQGGVNDALEDFVGPAGDAMPEGGPGRPDVVQVRTEVAGLIQSLARDEAVAQRLSARNVEMTKRYAAAVQGALAAGEEVAAAEESHIELSARADQDRDHLDQARSKADTARAQLRMAEADSHRWEARAEALALALDQARHRAGVASLVGVAEVMGTLAELVVVDDGFEAAFEAAIGESAGAVVLPDREAARLALAHLASSREPGSILAVDAGTPDPGSGGAASGSDLGSNASGHDVEVGPDAEPVRAHVRSVHPGVDGILDRILSRAVVVSGGWAEAVDAHLSRPWLVVVTKAGDRISTWSWRIGGPGVGATGAALEEARNAIAGARTIVEEASRRSGEADAEVDRLAASVADATQLLVRGQARIQAASFALQRHEPESSEYADQLGQVQAEQGELAETLHRDTSKLHELKEILPDLEAHEAQVIERRAQARDARQRLAERARAVADLRREFEVNAAGLEERRAILAKRRDEVEEQLDRNRSRRDQASVRRLDLEHSISVVSALSTWLASRMAVVDSSLARVGEQRRTHAERSERLTAQLDQLRAARADTERQLLGVRQAVQRGEIEEAETRVRYEAAVEALRRDLDCEPASAMDAPVPELPPGQTVAARARDLERELRLMGPINPLALEELEALEDRHKFLEAQLEDVRSSRRELFKVIKAIDAEIVDVFVAAYADVADNFSKLFTTLFPGGTGRLSLTEPDSLLTTGIEVDARPAGKNVRKLSLLSGGERSLVAMAFLFAVFRSRPAPFYLMDEVEAALDDVNLHRFLDLIDEFRAEAQLVIVSHQKRTMEAADSLLGVSMQAGQSSKVVSERLRARA
ncbi:MAG: chromosome segregation protein SMC [Acidimicrobiales bacterium]